MGNEDKELSTEVKTVLHGEVLGPEEEEADSSAPKINENNFRQYLDQQNSRLNYYDYLFRGQQMYPNDTPDGPDWPLQGFLGGLFGFKR